MNFIDQQFHIQQARLRASGERAVRGQKAVAPIFSADEAAYYDIPAITRKRAIQAGLDNQIRIAEYVDRVRLNFAGEAA